MQEDGIGDLYRKYEELKAKLQKEGYFAPEHKRKIPYMPQVIGVLTSATGAVIKDIINVSTRRNPNVHIRLLPVPVQGAGAEVKIAEAVEFMNKEKLADVLILARGGGSIEDLWPFNEEVTVKAVYNSEIPVISAVGHETDFTISDFAADLRAATPSAAAEIAVQDIKEIKFKLETYNKRYKTALKKKLEYTNLRYEKTMKSRAFTDPYSKINEQYILIDNRVKELEKHITVKIQTAKLQTGKLVSKLDAMSPLKTLIRGYCIVGADVPGCPDRIVKSSKDIKLKDRINLKFHDGERKAEVIE